MRDWALSQPDPQAPGEGTVRCWRVPVQDVPPVADRMLSILDAPERERMNRLRQSADRRRFLFAHAGLRILLGAALGDDPRGLRFVRDAHGKPALQGREIEFNLSHSGGVALIGLSLRAPVGVDVEEIRSMAERDAIAARFFHPGEAADLAAFAEAQRERAFFQTWTRKEAVVKALGLGLSLDLRSFHVSCAPDQPARLCSLPARHPPASQWSLLDLAPQSGHVGAIATPHRPVRLVCRTLDLAA